MKKILALFFLLLLALPGAAAVKEFEGFMVNVPRGWETEVDDGSVYVTNKDETAMLAITCMGEQSQDDLQSVFKDFVSSNELDQSKAESYPDGYSIAMDFDGEAGVAYIFLRDGVLFMVASMGEDRALEGILDSITPTEQKSNRDDDRGSAGGQQGTPTLLELSTPT